MGSSKTGADASGSVARAKPSKASADPDKADPARPRARSRRPASNRARSWSPGRELEFIRLANLLFLAADPSRVLILLAIGNGNGTANAKTICEQQGLSPATAYKQFSLLRRCGLIIGRKKGLDIFYSLTEEGARLYPGIVALVEGG